MRIGVVFPQTEIGADVGAVRAYGAAGRRARIHTRARLRPRGRRGPDRAHAVVRPLRRAHDVSRADGAVRIPGGDHVDRARDGDHHPAATPNRARGEAGGGGRPAHGRPVPLRGRDRLERGRVRGARQGLLESGPSPGGADRVAAPPVDGAERHLRGRVRARHRRRARAAPRAAAHPGVDRRELAARVPRASAASPTAGSRRSRRGPRSTRRVRSSTRPRATPAAIRRRSAWKGG